MPWARAACARRRSRSDHPFKPVKGGTPARRCPLSRTPPVGPCRLRLRSMSTEKSGVEAVGCAGAEEHLRGRSAAHRSVISRAGAPRLKAAHTRSTSPSAAFTTCAPASLLTASLRDRRRAVGAPGPTGGAPGRGQTTGGSALSASLRSGPAGNAQLSPPTRADRIALALSLSHSASPRRRAIS